MKTIMIMFGILLILATGLILAHEYNFAETKQLIDSKLACDKLNDNQLEVIGDYYMEQMHPGGAHEMMDQMMGGKGSESLKQMHINIAKSIYCNEDVGMGNMMNMMSSGMMDGNIMGSGAMNSGMMGRGMMAGREMIGNNYQTAQDNNPYQNNFFGFQIFFYVILTLLIIVSVLAMILLIDKSKNSSKQGRRNNRK